MGLPATWQRGCRTVCFPVPAKLVLQTIVRAKDYSLRLYGVYPVVEMAYVQRQEGYAALGSFIDGDNAERVRFAYTQPVTMCYPQGANVSAAESGRAACPFGHKPAHPPAQQTNEHACKHVKFLVDTYMLT
jgi:hypothetical protein